MTEQRPNPRQDLETQVRELTLDELEHVGAGSGAVLADGSVRFIGTTDYKWLTHLDRAP